MACELVSYLNGRILPALQASLPLNDAGFLWGATITDRLRTFRQRPFRLEDHLRRFRSSCEQAFVPQPRTDAELAGIVLEVIEANVKKLPVGTELTIALFATPGAGEPTLGVTVSPLDFARNAPLFRDGAILEPMPFATTIDPSIKHRSRLNWWISQQELRARPGVDPRAESLFTSDISPYFVRETAVANFLAVINGVLVSPPRSTILPGISLLIIEEIAGRLGITFHERELPLKEVLEHSEECLLANTSYCLAPVSRLAKRSKPLTGRTFQQLLRAWSDLVGVDILRQFLI
ncbi:MAG: aminotransferase class IV [Planctomycetes bacterium]|nr:aminotransferase class IV [Planctomycetota bacterium]